MAGEEIPKEFTSENVAANSPKNARLFNEFLNRGEPGRSLQRLGLTFRPEKDSPTGLNFADDSHYYNVGEGTKAAAYWAEQKLPQPTKDIQVLRQDLDEFGYCLVQDALSPAQLKTMRQRFWEQAEGEKKAGIGLWLNSSAQGSNTQFVANLANKGLCFEDFLEHNARSVQAGPLLEQLMGEALGNDFILTSFLGVIAHKDGFPQALHQDQGSIFQTYAAPIVIGQMAMLDDVGPMNGGTIVVPTSHRLAAEADRAGNGPWQIDLPPPVNVTAPAGTVLLWDGRLLHGTGVNRTDQPRHVVIAACQRSNLRQQETWHLSLSPEVLQRASDKLLLRLGFMANTLATVEGHGLGASGRMGDEFSSTKDFRMAFDRGEYVRVGPLSPDMPEEELLQPFTYRTTASGKRSIAKARKFNLMGSEEMLSKAESLAAGGKELQYKKRGNGNNEITAESSLYANNSKL